MLEYLVEERVLVPVEDLLAHIGVQELRVAGVDGGDVPDHAVHVDGNLRYLPGLDQLVHDQHHLLRPAGAQDRDQHLPLPADGADDDPGDLVLGFLLRGQDVVLAAVCRFDDHAFQPGERCGCRIEQPGPAVLLVSGIEHVVQAIADMEVDHGAPQGMAGIVEGDAHVRGDVRDLVEVQGDGVFDLFPDLVAGVDGLFPLIAHDLHEVQLQQGSGVPRGLGAVDRPAVAELVEIGYHAAMVHVRMGEDDRVQLLDVEFRGLKIGIRLVSHVPGRVDAAVHQDPGFRGLEEKAAPADLPAGAQHGEPNPFLALLPPPSVIDAVADAVQELPPVIGILIEDRPHVLDDLGADGGHAPDDRYPEGLLADLAQDSPLLADGQPGLVRLDDHDAALGIEYDVPDLCLCRDYAPDGCFCLFLLHADARIRPELHALLELFNNPFDDPVVVQEKIAVFGIEDDIRALEDRVRYLVRGQQLLHLFNDIHERIPFPRQAMFLSEYRLN